MMRSWPQRSSFCALTILLWAGISAAVDLASAKRPYQERDYATAFKECKVLPEQGNADAEVLLARMYVMGQGVLRDSDQALRWFETAAAQGNADAQYFVGAIYLLPQKDVGEGMKWLRLSTDQGHQDAQFLLGKAYMRGAKELPPDPVQADMWLRLAAEGNLEFYENELRAAEGQMSSDQAARGRVLAAAWKLEHRWRSEEKRAREERSGVDGKPQS